jgi:hypothetical protein
MDGITPGSKQMADRITHTIRNFQVDSPLPHDVLPNIMLRMEDRQAFTRLACTCRGFYAWSEPWLKSRKYAAELGSEPQWRVKLPAWIKTHTQHLHPADWKALLYLKRDKGDWGRHGRATLDITAGAAMSAQPGFMPAGQIDTVDRPHLDFVLFSPRLRADVNLEVAREGHARLAVHAHDALVGFRPTGEAWECDVLAGATAWLKENTETMSVNARSMLLEHLMWAMKSVMVAQRSPALALQLIGHGLVKSHYVKTFYMLWEDPLLTALIDAASACRLGPGSSEAVAFIGAAHRMVSTLAQLKESRALSVLVDDVALLLRLMPEKTWSPGSAGTACLQALVQAVRDLPDRLADIRKTLLDRHFITPGEWDELLLAVQGTSSSNSDKRGAIDA